MIENKEHFLKLKAEDGDELRGYKAREFIRIIEGGETIDNFDIDLYYKMIEKMTVFEDEKIVVSLLDGTKIEIIIE